ncbi:hypothetical protein HUT16_00840 [Kitasatospora sp. NA04385]|uniref:hypothetical protein n=1 Tax=Kitasatospora sp. NA04385 TaxID=2742135 RepID=UPI001590FA0D|nr:hypothetical protein [Kitasatospora sp. NA04385]QKW17797.1 hypothetical protein HUT16_00840 [Kitasatospora sp. NA04385]
MSRPSPLSLAGTRARRTALSALVVASSAGLAIAPIAAPGAVAADKKHPITIAVTTDPSLPQPGDGGAAYLAEVKKGVAAAAELWSDESDGNIEFSIETTRWVPGLGTCDGDRGPARERVAKAVGFTGGPRKHLIVAVGNCTGGGNATGSVTGGPDSGGAVYVPGLGSGATYSHELGHNLGFGHAGLLVCPTGTVDGSLGTAWGENGNCKNSEYGDAWDVQGRSRAWMLKPLSSPNRIRLGWFGADRYRVVQGAGADQQVTISARDNESGLVAVQATDPGTGRTFYVELSRPVDRDKGLEDPGGRVVDEEGTKFRRGYGVRILRYIGKGTSTTLVPTAAGRDGVRNEYWSPGEAFQTAGGGLRVEVVGIDGGQATLRISTAGGAGHPSRTPAASAAAPGTPTASAVASPSGIGPGEDASDPADTFIADPATSDDTAAAGQPTAAATGAAASGLAKTGADLSVGVVGIVLVGVGAGVFLVVRNRRPQSRHRR